jgi:hypothetical protein
MTAVPHSVPDPDSDPRPEPPPQPDLDACCGSGCDPCIFDLYDLEMDKYRQALRAWKARHPEAAANEDRGNG